MSISLMVQIASMSRRATFGQELPVTLAAKRPLKRPLCFESRGQQEGWVRKSLEPQGAANVILAVFSGLALDQEIGVRTCTAATAVALSDLFSLFVDA
jgi:hypothetical protein